MSIVADKLRELGLQPPASTLLAERNEQMRLMAADQARAERRARHLEQRAARKPLASNGRRKDLQRADQLRAIAGELAAAQT